MGSNLFLKITGVTLVELLVSLTIGLILTAACIQLFLYGKQSYQLQQGFARIQENARAANILLGQAIRNSGHFGCRILNQQLPLKLHVESEALSIIEDKVTIKGLTSEQLKNLSLLSAKAWQRTVTHSEILWINSAQQFCALAQSTKEEEEYLLIKCAEELKINQMLVLADCSQVEILQVMDSPIFIPSSNLQQIPIATTLKKRRLNKIYSTQAKVGVLSTTIFYIGNTFRQNASGQTVFALYTRDFNDRTWELIEGVEYLQFLWGVRQNNRITYLPTSQVNDWQNVVSVRVLILFNSIEEVLIQPQAYQLKGEVITPKDRLLRKWGVYEWSLKSM